MLEAENAGLPNNSTSGRVTLGAIKSLLAKVYLTMAGNPLNQADKYNLAKDKANEVINSSGYNLFQTDGSSTWFDKLNNPAFDNLEENIFMVQYASSGVTSTFTSYFSPLGGEDITDQNLHFGGMEPEADLSVHMMRQI